MRDAIYRILAVLGVAGGGALALTPCLIALAILIGGIVLIVGGLFFGWETETFRSADFVIIGLILLMGIGRR